MSSGRVWHVGCHGEFVYEWERRQFRCTYCDAMWDGKASGIAEYREVKP